MKSAKIATVVSWVLFMGGDDSVKKHSTVIMVYK